MKRTFFWLAAAILTFMLGIGSTLFWLWIHGPTPRIDPTNLSEAPKDRPILAYCELANNPDKYNGQIVRVSTRLSGHIHGSSFYDQNCSGDDTFAAVLFDPVHEEEIERNLKQARGSDNWHGSLDIIATGTFKKVTPSNESDTVYDRASLQFEIIRIEKASKSR